jgi:hypothetical protein
MVTEMKVRDYLARDNASSQESGWLDLTDVSISSGEMVIADPSLYPDGLVVRVCPGVFHIQVMLVGESGCLIVSRLRAYSNEDNLIAGIIGEVGVDFARLGLGDNVRISGVTNAITPEMAEPIWQSLETEDVFGVVPWDIEAGVEMPFVKPGYGDGRYDVRELLNGQTRVGVQIEFLQDQD